MPIVNIQITRDGITPAHKERLIQGATQLLVDVLDKDPNSTFVIIDEVDTDDWGWKGQSVTSLRKQERR